MSKVGNLGEILIPDTNQMTAKYMLIGQDVFDVESELYVKAYGESNILTEITCRGLGESEMLSEIMIKHGGYSEVQATIHPIISNSVNTEITILEGNVMSALYEVASPPVIKLNLNPFADSFTRSRSPFNTVNFGTSNSLNVGTYQNDTYESFMRFNLTNFSKHNFVLDATLRIYYNGDFPNNSNLELLLVNEEWTEPAITGRNQPKRSSSIISEYELNTHEKYIEFELTQTVVDWVQSGVNFGLAVRKADSEDTLITFRSRESGKSPQLIVSYYDTRVYSAGRSQTLATLHVAHGGISITEAEVTVSTVAGDNDVSAEVYLHRFEDPMDYDILSEMTVSQESIHSEVTVSKSESNDIPAELSCASRDVVAIEAVVTVSNSATLAEMDVKYREEIDAEISVIVSDVVDIKSSVSATREYVYAVIEVLSSNDTQAEITVEKYDVNDVLTNVTVSREAILAEVFVKLNSDVLSEISIQKYEEEDKIAELTVSREAVHAEVFVLYNDSVDVEVTVQKRSYDDILTEVSLSRPDVLSEIMIRALGGSAVDSEVIVERSEDSDKNSTISVTREYIFAEVIVKENSDIESEVFVMCHEDVFAEVHVLESVDVDATINVVKVSDTEAEVYILYSSDINAEVTALESVDVEATLNVVKVSDVKAVIALSRKQIEAEIMIPYWDVNGVEAEIIPRVLGITDTLAEIVPMIQGEAAIEAVIRVGKIDTVGNSYVFII